MIESTKESTEFVINGTLYIVTGRYVTREYDNAVVSCIGTLPNEGQVTFQPVEEAKVRKSGIVLATEGAEVKVLRVARVVAVGPRTSDDNTDIFEVGDYIAFTGATSLPFKIPFDDTGYLLSAARNLLGHVLQADVIANLTDGVTS